MPTNRAFWKALHSLAHPLSIAAILLLLFNDHWLRYAHPSWLTGKLGDFTWLLFAPFIAALPLAWLMPQQHPKHSQRVGQAAILLIGAWFALAKTTPLVHGWTTDAWNALIGWQGSLRMDTTDLLTLPALLLSWWIWQRAADTPMNLRPLAYVAFALGIIGTLASDGPAYRYENIDRIWELTDGTLITYFDEGPLEIPDGNISHYAQSIGVYESRDGGLSWQQESVHLSDAMLPNTSEARSSSISEAVDPNNGEIRYRWTRLEQIEKSTDGGDTWETIRDLYELRQSARFYYNHNSGSSFYVAHDPYQPSPVSGLVHSTTGNIVLAMSRDGVLVGTPEGQWHWAAVGQHALAQLEPRLDIPPLLSALVITLCALILTSLVAFIEYQPHSSEWSVYRIGVIAGWLAWLALVFMSNFDVNVGVQSSQTVDTSRPFALISLPMMIIVAIPWTLRGAWRMTAQYPRAWLIVVVVSVLANAGFLFPFVLWSTGTVPRFVTAAFFSILLTGAVLFACYQYFGPRLPEKPVIEKTKRKNDDKAKNATASD